MKLFTRHPIVIVFILALIGLSAVTFRTWQTNQDNKAGGGRGSRATVVETVPASISTIVDKIEAIGTTQANESVQLTAKVTDTVRRVNFEDGMYVEEGFILVELTNSEETAQLTEAQATVDEATRQFNRVRNLVAQKLASETQIDVERARMQTAEARLEAIVARLDDRLIRAPFSGSLGFRNISAGTLLTPTTVVTTLDDISTIKLDFAVPENVLASLRQGQEVIAESAAYPGLQFTGTVATINSRVDPVTRSVMVRAMLPNDERKLRPGMLLTVSLVQDRVTALTIPEEAIVPIQNRQYVYTVDEDGNAQRVEITTNRRRPGLVEVTSGLQAGDEVITRGVIKVTPGTPVIRKGERQPAAGAPTGRPGGNS
ncbi:MAG: efflux RND transporter periplasmic adaptor subunit [Pseudomonadales bacterium]|nr:efflux RND transporter periplasmic adaptor subunit [Pseudomonadales bacterium]